MCEPFCLSSEGFAVCRCFCLAAKRFRMRGDCVRPPALEEIERVASSGSLFVFAFVIGFHVCGLL